MVDPADAALRFDDFELHPESGELFHQQRPIHLQQQPARVLEILARRPGEVVTRGELRQAIWGEGHHVDADQGLNYCVRQIRLALDDRADAPRFVETVPRRGYRFVAPILAASTPSEPAESKSAPFASPELASPVRQRATWWLLGIAAGWVMVSGLRFAVPRPDSDHSAPLGPAAIPQAGLESSIDSLPADAREAYLRGVYLAARPLTQGRLRAVAPLEEAIALAPDFAPAHAAWAGLILVLHQPPLETLPQVEAAAERALGLDPELVAGHVVRGKVRMARHHDWAGAEASFRRALELDPSSVEAHLGYGKLLSGLGRHDEALAQVHRARELDPADALVSADLGWFYYFARRYTEAEKHGRATLDLDPNSLWALTCLVLTAVERGDSEGALAFARQQLEAEVAAGRIAAPAPEVASLEAYWRARLALYDVWRRQGFYVSPSVDATTFLALSENEHAIGHLDQACREGSLAQSLAVDRRFDPLREDPRFDSLLECAGFSRLRD